MWTRNDLIERFGVSLVIDVGANEGQYARALRAAGYSGGILSFEPLNDAYERLRLASADDARWNVSNIALGERNATATINVSANLYSSSLLPITRRCIDAAPDAAYLSTEQVEVVTLDSLDIPDGPLLLKADVQGYEPQVLRGGEKLLSRVVLLELELSLVPLYEGGLLAHQVCALAREYGLCRSRSTTLGAIPKQARSFPAIRSLSTDSRRLGKRLRSSKL